jgi:hypothetical protein
MVGRRGEHEGEEEIGWDDEHEGRKKEEERSKEREEKITGEKERTYYILGYLEFIVYYKMRGS